MKQIFSYLIVALLTMMAVQRVEAQRITLKVNGTNRTHIEYVPKNLGKKRPLLISCHGASQDAIYMRDTQMKMGAVADTAKFLIVFPDGINNQWDISGDRDINYILALIDEMARKYDIDRNRVYLSGFSMGGMLTYHAMNKIADKIAAFAPISGYPLWGSEAKSSRPIPILHTQGTGDDVVSADGIRGVLDKWVKRNKCNTTPKEIKKYKGYNHANLYIWGGGDEGVEVRLLELIGKGHWVSNDGLITGEEIWLFCKNYSLNKTNPNVSITSPKTPLTYTCFAPMGQATFPAVDITADASDPNGTIAKVEFYDGNTLIATCEKKPYKATFENKKSGTHTIKVVAIDNDGEKGSATIDLTYNSPMVQYSLSQFFTEAGSLPAGWTTDDGKEQRTGPSNGYTLGCRVFQFTANRRGFNYGLYFRNVEGKPKAGTAKYGLASTNTTLTLQPGKYALKHRICNWNKPEFSPVDISIEKRSNGQVIASQTYTPTVNIGNDPSNSFGMVPQQVLEFEVTDTDDYVLVFHTAEVEYGDGVIGQLLLTVSEFTSTGIEAVHAPFYPLSEGTGEASHYHNLQGQQVSNLTRGIYIHKGKKVYVK